MSDDQDGCEWVNVSSVPAYPGSPGQKAIKWLCVCVVDVHVVIFLYACILCIIFICTYC